MKPIPKVTLEQLQHAKWYGMEPYSVDLNFIIKNEHLCDELLCWVQAPGLTGLRLVSGATTTASPQCINSLWRFIGVGQISHYYVLSRDRNDKLIKAWRIVLPEAEDTGA